MTMLLKKRRHRSEYTTKPSIQNPGIRTIDVQMYSIQIMIMSTVNSVCNLIVAN